MRHHPAPIAALAAAQHGKVARRQLLALGMSPGSIKHRVRTGTMIRCERGVVAVGHVPATPQSRWSGAVLAAGEGAVLSHLAAARHWRLLAWTPDRIDVSRTRQCRPLPGVHVHETPVEAHEIRQHDGIDVTSPSRTIADCAQLLVVDQLVRLLREARHQGLLDLDELDEYADPVRRRRGAPRLREAMRRFRGRGSGYRSGLERRVRNLLVDRAAPEPLVNVVHPTDAGGIEVDLSWPALNICVEVDGPTHDDPAQRLVDDRRRAALRRAGWDVHVVHHLEFARSPVESTDPIIAALVARRS